MSGQTAIEWTDRTWNPLTGCTKVSPGCDHCYAKTMHERFNGPGSFDTITLHPDRMTQPISWRKPSRVFVNSMSDLFHKDVADVYIEQVFRTMSVADHHTFQVLTKRPARMRSLLNDPGFQDRVNAAAKWPLRNVWLGVSVEDQQWADIRIPALLNTPAAVRFLSCEPLLGPVDLIGQGGNLRGAGVYALPDPPDYDGGEPICQDHGVERCSQGCTFIDWVIVGGESGPGARPMQPSWARSLRDQCQAAGVPFLFKQWGEHEPRWTGDDPAVMHRVGKKRAGRELDGRTWDEYPDSKPHAEVASSR